uniref:Uncharacterized protein n=1 Tax=Rhizophagus irregularis (strain DAOM 181602 / DAOM 197198 / MUCL 43194) TaxID=747089 RepID=U9TGV3_RHIID
MYNDGYYLGTSSDPLGKEFWPLLYTRIQETSFEVRTWIAFQNFLKLQQEVVIHNNIIRLYGIMKDESPPLLPEP